MSLDGSVVFEAVILGMVLHMWFPSCGTWPIWGTNDHFMGVTKTIRKHRFFYIEIYNISKTAVMMLWCSIENNVMMVSLRR